MLAGIHLGVAACAGVVRERVQGGVRDSVAGSAIRPVRGVRSVVEVVGMGAGGGWIGLRTASSSVLSPCRFQPASGVAPSLRVPSAFAPAREIAASCALVPPPACAELFGLLLLVASVRVPQLPLVPSIAQSRRPIPIVLVDLTLAPAAVAVLGAAVEAGAAVELVAEAGRVVEVGWAGPGW